MNLEQTANPTLSLRDMQSSHVKNLVAFMCKRTFDYANGTITETWSTEYNPTYTSIKDTVSEQAGGMVVKRVSR